MNYHLVLFGPPGAGKGTQARLLAAAYDLAHLTSGELLRAEVAKGSALGEKAESFLAAGRLVPDELLFPLIEEAIVALPAGRGFILDGVPRSRDQAVTLQRLLERLDRPLDAVVLLDVPDQVVRERLMSRGRADDTPAAIQTRLDIFHDVVDDLASFYSERGLWHTVDGVGDEETVFQRIVEELSLPQPAE